MCNSRIVLRICLCIISNLVYVYPTGMSIDSFTGPPTTNEINSFIWYIKSIEPVTWLNTTNMANEYAQGHSGEAIKAMGLMYILLTLFYLNVMIFYQLPKVIV